jgi:hypothetical protein
MRPLACWDCGFESRQEHGCLSLVSVVFCQVEVHVWSWSLVRSSPTECGVCECDGKVSIMRRPWPTSGCCAMGGFGGGGRSNCDWKGTHQIGVYKLAKDWGMSLERKKCLKLSLLPAALEVDKPLSVPSNQLPQIIKSGLTTDRSTQDATRMIRACQLTQLHCLNFGLRTKICFLTNRLS